MISAGNQVFGGWQFATGCRLFATNTYILKKKSLDFIPFCQLPDTSCCFYAHLHYCLDNGNIRELPITPIGIYIFRFYDE